MDAAHKYFNKTVLFLAIALLMVVSASAQTPSFVLNGTSGNAAAQLVQNQAATVSVASSLTPGTEIAFTVSVAYGSGDQPWLNSQYIPSSGTTPTTLTLLPSYSGPLAVHPAVITLTATSPSGVTTATITVTYPTGSTTTGIITATPSSVILSAAVGAATSTTVSLNGNSGITFGIATATTPAGGSWLGATLTSGYGLTVPSSLTITANAYGLTGGQQYTGTVTVTPTNGAAATVIGVTFTVGTVTGNLTASPNSFSWSYTTVSGTYPSAQTVALASSIGQTNYTAYVDSSSPWLEANGSYPSTSGNIASGISVGPNPTYMNSLSAGNYTGYVHVSDYNGNTALITVYLTVNGGSTSGITWSPNPVTITAAAGGSQQQLQVNSSSATAGTFTASISGSGLSVSGVTTSTTSPASAYVIVYGNPSGLSSYTYSGNLSVTLNPTSGSAVYQTIPVTFTVGSGGIVTTAGSVTPTSLTFAYQNGTAVNGQTLPSQNIVVSGTGQFSVSGPTYPSGYTGNSWLSFTPSTGYAPATISVTVNPTGLAPNTTPYTATLAVTPAYGYSPITVSVSFLVTTSPVLVVYPGTLTFNYTAGGAVTPANLYLNASDGSAMPVSAATSTSWLSVGAPGGPTTNTVVSVQGNALTSLSNGIYTGSVTVTATGAANSPVSVPVVLTVTGSSASGGGLTLGSLSTFYATQNGSAPASQTLSVGASSLTYYSASATSTGNWLSISPSGNSLNTGSNPSLAVSVNQSGLTANTYYGTITLVANNITQTVQVTLVVSTTSSSGGTGNVTVTANGVAGTPSLTFTYMVGGSAPPAQTLQVVSASGSAPVSFTISSSATWLSAGVTNGTSLNTPVNNPGFTIGIMNASTLAAGPYAGTITITPNGGTVVTVQVSLTAQAAPTVTVSTTTLSFAYQAGNANPTPATLSISGGGQSLPFTVQVTSGSGWLSVSPTSGMTPTTGTFAVTVTATPGTMGAGTYNGTILVAGSGIATGSTSVNVTLTVTAPLPTINSVVNAASFVKGAVSPGEIVTLFGTAMGPAAAAYATIDPATGKLATSIGGVQVLFNGILAPMIYATATQISAVVPYEIAPISSPSAWISTWGRLPTPTR